MGGGNSIDRASRKLGSSYWAEEMMTEADVARAVDGGPVDVWVTHDAVSVPPVLQPSWFADPHLQHDLNVQRERVQTVFDALRPAVHVRGHFHVRYSAPTAYGTVYGLGFENWRDSLGIFDTETLNFA